MSAVKIDSGFSSMESRMAAGDTQVPGETARPSSAKRTWAVVGVVVLVVAALFAAFAVAMYFMVSGLLKDSDAYRAGIRQLEANSRVMELLGPPITTGLPSGRVHTSGASGEAQLAIPVEGQKASGVLYVVATKSAGVWKTDLLQLQLEGGAERIDIIGGGTPI